MFFVALRGFLETPGGWNGRVGSQMAMKSCSGHWNSWPEPAPRKVLARWAPSIQVPLTVSPRFRLSRISRDFSQQNFGISPKLGISLTRNWICTKQKLGIQTELNKCNQERMGELKPHSGLSKRFGCSVLSKIEMEELHVRWSIDVIVSFSTVARCCHQVDLSSRGHAVRHSIWSVHIHMPTFCRWNPKRTLR